MFSSAFFMTSIKEAKKLSAAVVAIWSIIWSLLVQIIAYLAICLKKTFLAPIILWIFIKYIHQIIHLDHLPSLFVIHINMIHNLIQTVTCMTVIKLGVRTSLTGLASQYFLRKIQNISIYHVCTKMRFIKKELSGGGLLKTSILNSQVQVHSLDSQHHE